MKKNGSPKALWAWYAKLLVMAKLTILLILATCLQAYSRAQGNITLSEKAASLETIFKKIKKQAGYRFAYKPDLLNNTQPVDISVSNAKLEEVMKICLHNQPISYTLIDKTVVLKAKEIEKKLHSYASDGKKIDVRGRVFNDADQPVPSVTVSVKGSSKYTLTDQDGQFTLTDLEYDATLVFTHISMELLEVKINGREDLSIQLRPKINELSDVTVTFNTGYQDLPKERVAGSFVKLDNELINRRVSTNLIDRLDGVTSGTIFNKNGYDGQSAITIRSRSTIFANANPLIVIDNFPYDGDLSTINPNDIESITVLRDAAAASIWGAFSGNGVIVITTKKGKLNQPLKVTFNANFTSIEKPDLWSQPRLNSDSYIEIEKWLYGKGFYNSQITSVNRPELSPVVEILLKRTNGQISQPEADAQIANLGTQDVRDDVSKYFYRKAFNQQYSLNLSGGGNNNQYYVGFGFDKNLTELYGNGLTRVTLNANNVYSLLNQRLEFTTGLVYTRSNSSNNGISLTNIEGGNIPYWDLVDNQGRALVISNNFRQSYIDTAGGGRLLDWKYRPYDELNLADKSTILTDYRLNAGVKYKIFTDLNVNLLYQYSSGLSEGNSYFSPQTYFTRDLINRFTQINFQSGAVNRPIPLGGILDIANREYVSNNYRGQLSYGHVWQKSHDLRGIVGMEIRDVKGMVKTNRYYGYDDKLKTSRLVDYVSFFPNYVTGANARIFSNIALSETTNRFWSYFANFAYTYKGKYTITGSLRKDESNVFGATTNSKGVPLWSTGLLWKASEEQFYKISWLPTFNVRVTYGFNGNVDNTLSPFVTTTVSTSPNQFNSIYSTLTNPPNPSLRWEKTKIINIGVDFGLKGNIVSGSIEYYSKDGVDLIGISPIDPTTGVSTFKGNSATIKGNGLDVMLTSRNINTGFKWTTNLILSFAKDRVTKYLLQPVSVGNSLFTSINTIEGRPLYSIYSLPYQGLDSAGNPKIFFDGKDSKDYSAIFNSPRLENLKYHGPATPRVFGGIRNDFQWKNFNLSVNVTYKLGYYFRRQSIDYAILFNNRAMSFPNEDYENRWKAAGDELRTNIPSLIYPANNLRDFVYRYSDGLVEKSDHIRLQDLQFGYMLKKKQLKKLPLESLQLYSYLNNIGIIWRSNNKGIDPDFLGSSIPNPRSISFGIKAIF